MNPYDRSCPTNLVPDEFCIRSTKIVLKLLKSREISEIWDPLLFDDFRLILPILDP